MNYSLFCHIEVGWWLDDCLNLFLEVHLSFFLRLIWHFQLFFIYIEDCRHILPWLQEGGQSWVMIGPEEIQHLRVGRHRGVVLNLHCLCVVSNVVVCGVFCGSTWTRALPECRGSQCYPRNPPGWEAPPRRSQAGPAEGGDYCLGWLPTYLGEPESGHSKIRLFRLHFVWKLFVFPQLLWQLS